jgi:hypothetical protein
MRNVEPRPGFETTSIEPPFCSTAPYTIASPSPVPEPAGFVVKNGSKIRAWTSSLIPSPVSVTVITTEGPRLARPASADAPFERLTSIASVPPSGIASRALAARFSSTCSSCPWSTSTRHGSSQLRIRSATSSPIMRASIEPEPSTTARRSTTRGAITCCRLKASSWCVSAAARQAALSVSFSQRCARLAASTSRSASARLPVIAVSRLLKSWATPPARRPTASIFCDCRSRPSSAVRSLSARCRSLTSRRIVWYLPSGMRRELISTGTSAPFLRASRRSTTTIWPWSARS